jgi:hypothetical protein
MEKAKNKVKKGRKVSRLGKNFPLFAGLRDKKKLEICNILNLKATKKLKKVA